MSFASLARADRRLSIALATAFLWHGGLLLSGSHRRTYDAYIHMFFGDHYARSWFSTWETRWYTGFTTTSYPPGTHQLIALLSKPLGLEGAFVCIQLLSVLLLIIGVYRFSQIWVSKEAAGMAALLAVVSTSIAEVVHVFGQLPTSFSLAILLNTLPSIFDWVANGRWRQLLMALLGLAATTAGHHVTTLFGTVFFVGPVIATALIDRLRTPRAEETAGHASVLGRRTFLPAVARRVRRVLPATMRAGVVGIGAISALLIVVLPYWLWSSSDPIVQIPIPHASRDNFLENRPAGLVFFMIPWGVTIIALPIALIRGAFSRAFPLAASVGLLFVLGTGGTTPIPRMLLGGAFDILTLDRFTIWSTIAVLPLFGGIAESLVNGRMGVVLGRLLGQRVARASKIGLGLSLLAAAVLVANFTQFRPLQPDRIDPEPIAAFMEKDQHDQWRYLTLGFGDQMAIVSAATTATTVDGNYHSARRLPELTSRSVERLEGAKFRGVPGIGSLQQFLAVPETYNLKFVFSNDVFYDPLLWASGWHRLDRLQNDVVVWEREDIPPLPDQLPTRELPLWQRAMWGTLPMTAMVIAAAGLIWTWRGQRIGRRLDWLGRQLRTSGRSSGVAEWYFLLDRWLATKAAKAPAGAPRQRWYGSLGDRLQLRVRRFEESQAPPSSTARLALALAVVVTFAVGWLVSPASTPATPEVAVERYYNDLDFQRFDAAWDRLDAGTRPTFEQYLLELSVVDGLVSSYSKLDRIEPLVVADNGNRVEVEVDLVYITSLREHRRTETLTLHDRGGEWFIEAPPSDASTTPDQFTRSTSVDYLSQGRRQVTTEQSLFGDILDRPRIATLSANAIEADGRYSVVGEITNLDVDPADLTVTARFLDAEGEVLVEHNAGLVTVHKALPRETVPFRIDLEATAGTVHDGAAESFHPDLFASPTIETAEIATIELVTKAVVTGRDLERSVHAENLQVVEGVDGLRIVGQLRNDGTQTATVPHVLVTLLNSDGTVGWVDHVWIDEAIRPQRSISFEVPITDRASLEQLRTPLAVFGNGIVPQEGAPFVGNATLPLPPVPAGFAEARVSVHSFYRTPPS